MIANHAEFLIYFFYIMTRFIGRLNSNEMWGQHQLLPHQQQQPPQPQQQQPAPPTTQQAPQQNQQHSQIGVNKMVGPNAASGAVGQWAPGTINNQGKDVPIQQHKSSGWEEPSPPTQRRNMPNFDDGTSLWGQQQQQQPQVVSMQQTRVPHTSGSHWKEEMARTGLRNSVNVVQSSNSNIVGSAVPLTQARSGSNGKTDSLLWAHNSNINPTRNPSWEENSPNWEEKNMAPCGNITSSWGETPNTTVWPQQQQQQQKPKHMIGSGPGNLGWPEAESNDWGTSAHLPKPQSIKMAVMEKIRSSKQYRVLLDMGFKKEDIELALHATTLNLEEAIEILNQTRNNNSVEGWRRHEEQQPFEHNNYAQRFNSSQQASLAFVQVFISIT